MIWGRMIESTFRAIIHRPGRDAAEPFYVSPREWFALDNELRTRLGRPPWSADDGTPNFLLAGVPVRPAIGLWNWRDG